MKVVIVNKSDATGGAAVVSSRLLAALRDAGVDARMLVVEKRLDSPFVERAASSSQIRQAFLAERLKIFMANGMNRDTLFKIDTASDGLPLWRNRYVREADVICLNWVNQGMLSLTGLRKLMALGKPIVWTMHDMWCFTGICHHAGECERYFAHCGDCPLLLQKASPSDLSNRIWQKKYDVYGLDGDDPKGTIHFVAVSNWLAAKARESSLLRNAPMSVIPNAFPFPEEKELRKRSYESPSREHPFKIAFGAARLDDTVKGFPILIKVTELLSREWPEETAAMELVTFGNIKDNSLLDRIAMPHRHLGVIAGDAAVRRIYEECDAVLSTSLWETLPGTLVEGQAYGAIPVSFDRGGQSDIVDHEQTGYLARWNDDPEQAARNIAEGLIWAFHHHSPELTEHMRLSAQKKFAADAVASRYMALFKEVRR